MSKLAPRTGRTPGDLEFRFHRDGYTLAIDLWQGTRLWISVAMWMRKGRPSQPVFIHCPLTDAYLSAGGETFKDCDDKGDPALVTTNGTRFSLRPDEYEALRAYLLPLGLVHHVPDTAAVEVPTVRRADGRTVEVAIPENERAFGGEVEGCGGDAELDRCIP